MAEIDDSENQLLEEIQELETMTSAGVIKTSLITNDSITVLKGTEENPILVGVKADEDGGFITAIVNQEDFTLGTSIEQRRNIDWIFGTKEVGRLFTSADSMGTYPAIQVEVKKQYCGSAVGWLEGYIGEPTNTSPQGFFVKGICEPKIGKVEWREYHSDNQGAIINRTVKFGETIQLHIITEGLNGDKLHVDFYTEDDHWINSSFGSTFDGVLILNVPITSSWKSKFFSFFRAGWGSKAIKITIKYEALESVSPFYDGITIENELLPDDVDKKGVVPVSVGKTEIDTTSYLPCTYTEINLSTKYKDREDQEQLRKYIFFKQGELSRTSSDYFEVTAGKDNLKEVEISLASTLTTVPDAQCVESPEHKDRVFLLNGNVVEGSASTTPAAAEEESRFEGSYKVSPSASTGNNTVSATYNSSNAQPAKVQLNGDTLKLEIAYPYSFPTNVSDLGPFFRLFWPQAADTFDYQVGLNTCRHKKIATVRAYPDIQWAVSLDFNNADRQYTVYNRTYTVSKAAKVVPEEDQSWQKIGDFTVGLGAKITFNKDEEIKFSREIKDKYEDKIQGIKKFGEMLSSLFGGESDTLGADDPTNQPNDPAKKARAKADLQRIRQSNIAGLRDYTAGKNGYSDINRADRQLSDRHQGVKRDLMTIALLWPDISLALTWKLEETLENQDYINKVGTLLEASVVANPLVGLSLTLDFLALVQRAHPVALAIIAVADITLELFGDGSRIEVSLASTGKLSADVGGFINLNTGENTFNRDSLEGTDRKIAKASGDLKFKLTIGIFLIAETRVIFVNTVGELSASVEAEANFGADFALRADEQGFYIEPTMRFDGLEVSGQATARAGVKSRKPSGGDIVGFSATGTFKYTAIKKSSTVLEPWRFD